MDRTASKARAAPPGLSIRNGPVEDDDAMDVDGPSTNGKRKSRSSLPKVNYKDETEDSDDDAPLVGYTWQADRRWRSPRLTATLGQATKDQGQGTRNGFGRRTSHFEEGQEPASFLPGDSFARRIL